MSNQVEMKVCKHIYVQGKKKGTQCTTRPKKGEYCSQHVSNRHQEKKIEIHISMHNISNMLTRKLVKRHMYIVEIKDLEYSVYPTILVFFSKLRICEIKIESGNKQVSEFFTKFLNTLIGEHQELQCLRISNVLSTDKRFYLEIFESVKSSNIIALQIQKTRKLNTEELEKFFEIMMKRTVDMCTLDTDLVDKDEYTYLIKNVFLKDPHPMVIYPLYGFEQELAECAKHDCTIYKYIHNHVAILSELHEFKNIIEPCYFPVCFYTFNKDKTKIYEGMEEGDGFITDYIPSDEIQMFFSDIFNNILIPYILKQKIKQMNKGLTVRCVFKHLDKSENTSLKRIFYSPYFERKISNKIAEYCGIEWDDIYFNDKYFKIDKCISGLVE